MAPLTSKYQGTKSEAQDKVDRDTKSRLADIEKTFSEKREQLIKKLLDRVAEVDPQPHRNLHKIEA